MPGPLTEIVRARRYSEELERDGIPADSLEHRKLLTAFLDELTDEYCPCGERLSRLEVGSGLCRACQDATAKREEEAKHNPGRHIRMARINVPPAYRHCCFDTYDGSLPEHAAAFSMEKGSNTLLIFGPDTGIGKTHLGTAVLYSLYSKGLRCWWEAASKLAGFLVEETFTERPTFHRVTNVECLMLDDLGRELGVAPKAKELIMSVLDSRWQDRRRTIVTTNMTDDELCDYDARLASRLLAGMVVQMEGKDHRWESPQDSTES